MGRNRKAVERSFRCNQAAKKRGGKSPQTRKPKHPIPPKDNYAAIPAKTISATSSASFLLLAVPIMMSWQLSPLSLEIQSALPLLSLVFVFWTSSSAKLPHYSSVNQSRFSRLFRNLSNIYQPILKMKRDCRSITEASTLRSQGKKSKLNLKQSKGRK